MAEIATASVFMSGRSQAVRIPKAFWFDTERVEIRRRGQEVVLKPIAKEDQWASLKEVVATDDKTDWDEVLGMIDEPLVESPRLPMEYSANAYAEYERGGNE